MHDAVGPVWAPLYGRFGRLALLVPLLFCGCEPPSANPVPRRAASGFIAFVGASEEDPLWLTLRATAENYRAGLGGFGLTVVAPRERSVSAQLELLSTLDPTALRGLCIVPVDASLRDELRRFHQQGVAVVTLMTRVDEGDLFPHAGIDEMGVGQAMADALATALGGKGAIAVLDGAGGDRALADRRIGFSERLAQLPGINVLRELDCAGDPEAARGLVRDYLERFPRLGGWAMMDNWPLRGLPPRAGLLPKSCKLVTCRPYPEYWPLILDGSCHALIGARYEQVAEHALQMCVTVAQGQLPTIRTYLAPPVTVTKQNLAWFRQRWFDSRKMPAQSAVAPTPTAAPTE